MRVPIAVILTILALGCASGVGPGIPGWPKPKPPIVIPPDPPLPGVPVVADPIIGDLVRCGRSFCDANGPRTVAFASWFPALAVARSNWTEFTRQADLLATAGWQGVRIFQGISGCHDFFGPMAVHSFHETFDCGGGFLREGWPDYSEVVRRAMAAFDARRLRVAVSFAEQWYYEYHQQPYERLVDGHVRTARLFAPFKPVVWEAWNEGWVNRGDAGIGEAVLRAVKPELPGTLLLNSDCTGEDGENPECHEYWNTPTSDLLGIHHSSWPRFTDMARRIFTVSYDFDGGPRKPIYMSEGRGDDAPGQSEVTAGNAVTNDPVTLTALYMLQVAMGQFAVYFNGPAVRHGPDYVTPLDAVWGTTNLPRFLATIPREIGQWRLWHGARVEAVLTFGPETNEFNTPERIDQAVAPDGRVWAAIHGGQGQWHVLAKTNLRCELIRAPEAHIVDVDAGTTINHGWMHADQTVVIADCDPR